MRRLLPLLAIGLLALWFFSARPQWDVDMELPVREVDTTNVAVLRLSQVVERNPRARRIRLRWVVQPDASRPTHQLQRVMTYDRENAILAFNRETGVQHYEGVTPQRLGAVAAKMGAAPDLLKQGATQTQ